MDRATPLRILTAIVSAAALSLCPWPAAHAAAPIVDTGGFESYNLAQLANQQGWVTDTIPTPGSALVQTAVVKSGAKAVQVDRAANADKSWGQLVGGFPTGRFVLVEWEMLVTATGVENAVGPFFGVESHDLAGGTTPFTLLGSLGVDATTGEVLYQEQGSGSLVASTAEVVFGAWHNYRLLYDFALHQYSAYFDRTRILTTGFVDHIPVTRPLNDFTATGISALGAAADSASQALTGTAYFDNFRVWDGIPGDFNADGAINNADFNAWKTAFGTNSGADADGDGDSDGRDFLVWQRETGVNLLAATAAGSAVPEPAAAAIGLVAWGLGAYCRRRARAS